MISPERLLSTYRRAGADPPFGDPRRHHGVPMEGYFWRLTDVRSGRVVVAFTGVSRDAAGATWATVGLAEHPGGFVRTVVAPRAEADHERLGVQVGTQLRADEDGLDVDLGPGASLRVRFTERVGWPRRALGGVGLGHVVPGLGQYWHPHMLDARVEGAAQLGERRVELTGARAYGEKNWTPYARGFPSLWWWGQAHGFAREDVSVAFAGGRMLGIPAGAVVVRLGDELVHVVGPPAALSMRLGENRWALRARTAAGRRHRRRRRRRGAVPLPGAGRARAPRRGGRQCDAPRRPRASRRPARTPGAVRGDITTRRARAG